MNLYLIKWEDDNLPFYDIYRGHVIAAERPLKVRAMAAEEAADEGTDVWLDPKRCHVFLLAKDVKLGEKIILSNFNAG